jgi:DeoR/GlpR family transcriptional regulator of sugar metabolism
MVAEDPGHELPFDVRSAANLAAKRAIAAAALAHVVEGDVIGLDASSTACELAQRIPDLSLTVITNSLVIARFLASRPKIKTICAGGDLDAPSLSFVGSVAEAALERFHIDKLFFSCRGLDSERGLSVAADEHARMKRKMLDLATRAYLLADHSKFGVKSVVFFAPLSDVDVVITDSAADGSAVPGLAAAGVKVETAHA